MGIQQLYTLLKKYRSQACTPDERAVLESWYAQFDAEAEKLPEVPVEKLSGLLQSIEVKLRERRLHRRRRWLRVMAAAAVWMVMWFGCYYWISTYKTPPIQPVSSASGIMPGQYRAELVLDDGSRIGLNSHSEIRDRQGVLLKADHSEELNYTLENIQGRIGEYHTVKVPSGGEFRLILADGTKVWLNSGSVLTYPVAFHGESREVELTGEAYFQVTKSGIPFVVKTAVVNVNVWGTAFNLSAYPEDDCVITALVEGKVTVREHTRGRSYDMQPGYVFSYEKATEQTLLEKCDTELYTSWINGKFKFRDMRLEDIMTRLNRWYNCEFFYRHSAIKDLRFTGIAEKDRSIEYLLEMIETVIDVHFEIHGRTVVLSQK